MEQSITSLVDGQVFDFRAPPIAYAANAREHVVSDDLIEYLPIEPQVLGRLHVDQHVINYKVCIGTSHEFGRGAERRIEDAALLRPEKARPDESEHALKIINQCTASSELLWPRAPGGAALGWDGQGAPPPHEQRQTRRAASLREIVADSRLTRPASTP